METLKAERIDNSLVISGDCVKFSNLINNFIEQETGLTVVGTAYQSKYNTYVVYDYEPFCAEGFLYQVTLRGEKNYLEFTKRNLEKTIQDMQMLERCYKARDAKRNKLLI